MGAPLRGRAEQLDGAFVAAHNGQAGFAQAFVFERVGSQVAAVNRPKAHRALSSPRGRRPFLVSSPFERGAWGVAASSRPAPHTVSK